MAQWAAVKAKAVHVAAVYRLNENPAVPWWKVWRRTETVRRPARQRRDDREYRSI
jgi:hypothetical protein